MKSMTEVIQHVIALAINHAGFDDRIVQSRTANDFLGRPLGFVVRRITMWPRSEKAKKQNLLDRRFACGVYNILCPLNVNSLICLFADRAINSRTVSNRIASGKSLG